MEHEAAAVQQEMVICGKEYKHTYSTLHKYKFECNKMSMSKIRGGKKNLRQDTP